MAWYNQRWHDYTGTTPGEMADKGWDIAYDPQYLPHMLAGWKAALRDGTPFEMEFPIRGSDGQYRWFLTRANPVHRGKQLLRWFGTSTDVDEVKHVEEALRDETRVLELLNSTGTTLASTLDLPSLLQETVNAATRISGARFGAFYYDAEHEADVAGDEPLLKVAQAVSGVTARQAAAIASDLRVGPAMRHNDLQTAPDASEEDGDDGASLLRSCLSLPVRSRSGQLLGRLLLGHPQPGMFSQRSERIVAAIAAQAAVALDNTRLYVEARARRRRAQGAARERTPGGAEAEADQPKDEFLATLSHELRTPLAAMLGWAQCCAAARVTRQNGQGAGDHRAQCQGAGPSHRRPARHVPHHLRQAPAGHPDHRAGRRDQPRIETSPGRRRQGHHRGHRSPPTPAPCRATPTACSRSSGTCCRTRSNSRPPAARSIVTVAREGTRLVLTIADNGAGIGADFLPHVFDRFRQADASTTRKHGGLGLGLAIVKHLVELHGGTVTRQQPRRHAGRHVYRAPARRHPCAGPARGPASVPRRATWPASGCWWSTTSPTRANWPNASCATPMPRCPARPARSKPCACSTAPGPDILVSDIGMPEVDGCDCWRGCAHTALTRAATCRHWP